MYRIPKWHGSRHFGEITGRHSRPQFHLPPRGSLASWRTWRYLVAKVGTSKIGGKQWHTTPKNLPRMQRTRAIPVTWLSSGLCPNRPKGWMPTIIIISKSHVWAVHSLFCTISVEFVSGSLVLHRLHTNCMVIRNEPILVTARS